MADHNGKLDEAGDIPYSEVRMFDDAGGDDRGEGSDSSEHGFEDEDEDFEDMYSEDNNNLALIADERAQKYRDRQRSQILAGADSTDDLGALINRLPDTALRRKMLASFGTVEKLIVAFQKFVDSQDNHLEHLELGYKSLQKQLCAFVHNNLGDKLTPSQIQEAVDAVKGGAFDGIRTRGEIIGIASMASDLSRLSLNKSKLEKRLKYLQAEESSRRAEISKLGIYIQDNRTQIAKQENIHDQFQAGATQINHITVYPQGMARSLTFAQIAVLTATGPLRSPNNQDHGYSKNNKVHFRGHNNRDRTFGSAKPGPYTLQRRP
jgi:hypothetical protein